jgi:hypothetical protein
MHHLRLLFAAFIATAALLFAGCGGETYEIEPSSTAPSITGELKVQEYNESNYQAALSLKYLPLPQNLGQGLSTYIVWVNPQGTDNHIKVGNLRLNSESREGNLKFTTPHSVFKVVVTAEESPTVKQPSDPIVVSEQVVMQ